MWGLFALIFLLSFRTISDPDIWFYLVQGREIVTSGKLPASEFYIFPAQGEPAVYSAIGFAIFYYFVYQLGGFVAMGVANALMAATAILLLLRAAKHDNGGSNYIEACVIVGLVIYLLAEFRFVYRPENLLFVFLALELLILEAWLRDRRSLRLLALLPLVGLLSFFHTSAVLLIVVLACYLAQFVWDLIRSKPEDLTRKLLLVLSLVTPLFLVPWLNPNGWEQFFIILRGLFSFNTDLVEYLPALETEYRWHFISALLLAMGALLFAPRHRVVDWLLVAGFCGVAFLYARNIGLFALMIAVPLTRALQCVANRCSHLMSPAFWRSLTWGLVISVSIWTFNLDRWGTGVAADDVFSKSAAMIRQVSEGDNVMNFFHHGGYLAWELGPGYKVAVDGHFVRRSFAPEYHDRVMRADPDWKSLLARYDVKFILTPATLPYSGKFIPLVMELIKSEEWLLVNVEPAGLMFARLDIAPHWQPVSKIEIWKQAVREATLVLNAYPRNKVARATQIRAEQEVAR